MDMLKNACYLNLECLSVRYLVNEVAGKVNEEQHEEMCAIYTCVALGVLSTHLARRSEQGDRLFKAIHEKTRELTDHLDEVIGFPLNGEPDLDELLPKFFAKFHELAMAAIEQHKQ